MLLISSSHPLLKHQLTFIRLSDCMSFLPVVARWAEDEWGYIRNKGVVYREGVFDSIKNDVYIGIYAGQPVAMFALVSHVLPDVRELTYVYVNKDYRGFGFGRQIIDTAKHLTRELGAAHIQLDTLKPGLNRMYEKQGAKILCEHHLFSHTTDVLTIKL
jgi:GNAT superfamily N-acetyltransferase